MSRTARRRSSVRAALAIVAPWSGPRFEHHVKGRFGGATEPGEPAGAHHLPQFDLTRLRPETKPGTTGGEAVTRRLNPTGAEVYAERHQAERRNQPNTAKQHNCLGRMVV